MTTEIQERPIVTLSQVANSIKKVLADRYKGRQYWIKAEMNKLNFYSHSGHCFPELVEKKDDKVVAQLKANLWKTDYHIINAKFLNVLKEPLKDGIKILFLAEISFEPVHGLALRIIDIDPSYTLGDLEKEKTETIQKMKAEGIFDANKRLQMPLLPQRIAVISVETSKGFVDFKSVIESNQWKYKFFYLLFPSLLQGDKAIDTIIHQLERIKKVKAHFDVVAIIRGGGGDVGLSCYNNYRLAREIALFPIPVITGIGHATNETVVEMISNTNAITPTKIAEYLLQKYHDFAFPVEKAQENIINRALGLVREQKSSFSGTVKLFRSVTQNVLLDNSNSIKGHARTLIQQARFRFRNERQQVGDFGDDIKRSTLMFCSNAKVMIGQLVISMRKDTGSGLKSLNQLINQAETNVNNMSPANVLKRGYSVTYLNGKSVKNFGEVKQGDEIKTTLFDGNINSTVKSAQKTEENE
ncbi:MAG: exodeoxyribonuclease VII large subunit [Bacteroidia bacterium]